MKAVVTAGAGHSLWVRCGTITVTAPESPFFTLTRSVDGVVVKAQFLERQLHGTLQAWWGGLICARPHDSY